MQPSQFNLSQQSSFYEDPTPEDLFKELDEKEFAVPDKSKPKPNVATTIDKCGIWCEAVLGHLHMLQTSRK